MSGKLTTWFLHEVPILATWRTMVESKAIKCQGSVSTSLAHITSREDGDVSGLDKFWGPHGWPGAVHNWPCPHHQQELKFGKRSHESRRDGSVPPWL